MMHRRQKFLGLTALSLAIANLVAMPHTLAALNELRGGGGASVPAMSNSGGCGCSNKPHMMTEEQVKQILKQRLVLTQRNPQPVQPVPMPLPKCPDEFCFRDGPVIKYGCKRMDCKDSNGHEHRNTKHWRLKYIWRCDVTEYVWCSDWNPIPGDCCPSQNLPACNGNVGQILCDWIGRGPSFP
ncbi:MAG: hypothetical protein KatS3mg016_0767 [Fimbriimonadales bacterium]|nr:MAG: hypothetical protein KatS3mg016_0767 [Fimbriimonadales bacterium]